MDYNRWINENDCCCNGSQSTITPDCDKEQCSCEAIYLEISNLKTTDNVISGEVAEKQDKLIAGDNITISGNVISAVGGEGISSGDVQTMIENNLNGYATEQWVEDKHYITGVDLSNYATLQDIPTIPNNVSAFNNDAGYITGVDLSNYALKSEIPTVPTSNSAFTNDMHYVTSAETANYVTSGNVETQINNHFYCCSEAEWATISGNPQENVLYLIY